MTRSRPAAALLMALLCAACHDRGDRGPIDVSVVGPPIDAAPSRDEADRGALDAPSAMLMTATRQGLVRFDASGQIAPGLAVRWSVSDDGRSLLFRLADGPLPVSGTEIVRRLRAAVSGASRNPLRPLLGAIASITMVTPQVIDIELNAPRPTILPLFAQPSLAIGTPAAAGGPFAITRIADGTATLRVLPEHDADPDATEMTPLTVRLRGEAAAIAVARFAAGRAGLVTGGGFADLPIARAAHPAPGTLRFDPVAGLFGFAAASHANGAASTPEGRRALAMAIDRDRIARALDVPGWAPSVTVLPDGTPEIEQAARPDWSDLALPDRRAAAAVAVAPWRATALTVAMPAGPGARLLFRLVAADWRAIGIVATPVAPGTPADLTLIDEVAPADTAAFYLRRFACERDVPCTAESDEALIAARHTSTLAERSRLLAQADALIGATAPFVPLGAPIRWSLVAPTLDRFAASPRGLHPLDELRGTAP